MFDEYSFFPEWLYGSVLKITKGISPAASFSPDAALSSTGSAWQSASNPRSKRPKKHIILTRKSIELSSVAEIYALLLFLSKNKFAIYQWQGDALVLFNPDASIDAWLTTLNDLADFDVGIHFETCSTLGFSRDQVVVLDQKSSDADDEQVEDSEPVATSIGLINLLHQQALPYSSFFQGSPFNVVYGVKALNINHPDIVKWIVENRVEIDDYDLLKLLRQSSNKAVSLPLKSLIASILDNKSKCDSIEPIVLIKLLSLCPEKREAFNRDARILAYLGTVDYIDFNQIFESQFVIDIVLSEPALKKHLLLTFPKMLEYLGSRAEDADLIFDNIDSVKPCILDKLILHPSLARRVIQHPLSFEKLCSAGDYLGNLALYPDWVRDVIIENPSFDFSTIKSNQLLLKLLDLMPEHWAQIIKSSSIDKYEVLLKFPDRIEDIIKLSSRLDRNVILRFAIKFPEYTDRVLLNLPIADYSDFIISYVLLPEEHITREQKRQFFLKLIKTAHIEMLSSRAFSSFIKLCIEIAQLILTSPALMDRLDIQAVSIMCDDHPDLTFQIIDYLDKRYETLEARDPKLPWNRSYTLVNNLAILERIISKGWFVIDNNQIIVVAIKHRKQSEQILRNISEALRLDDLVRLAIYFPEYKGKVMEALSSFEPPSIRKFIEQYHADKMEEISCYHSSYFKVRLAAFQFVHEEFAWPQAEAVNNILINTACIISERPIMLELVHPLYIDKLLQIEDKGFLSEIRVINVNRHLCFMEKVEQARLVACLKRLSVYCPNLRLIQWPMALMRPDDLDPAIRVIYHQTPLHKFFSLNPSHHDLLKTTLDMSASAPYFQRFFLAESESDSESESELDTDDESVTLEADDLVYGKKGSGLLYIAKETTNTSLVSISVSHDDHFEMKLIGRGLNTKQPIKIRMGLVNYHFVYNSTSGVRLCEEKLICSSFINVTPKYIDDSELSHYKSVLRSVAKCYFFKQEIAADSQWHCLYSVHPCEVLDAIVQGSFRVDLRRGTDDFYYVRNLGTTAITLQYVLKLFNEDNLQGLDALPAQSIARKVIEDYCASSSFSRLAKPGQNVPPIPSKGNLIERFSTWTHNLFETRRGVCLHRAIAVAERIKDTSEVDIVRLVLIDNNHVALEILRPIGSRGRKLWIPVDVLGGSSVVLEYPHPHLLASFSGIDSSDPFSSQRHAIRLGLLKSLQTETLYNAGQAIEKVRAAPQVLFITDLKQKILIELLCQGAFYEAFNVQCPDDLNLDKLSIVLKEERPCIQNGGVIRDFIDRAHSHPNELFLLSIDWDAFTHKQILEMYELLEPERTLFGKIIPKNIRILGFCHSLSTDPSFLSRHQKGIYTVPAWPSSSRPVVVSDAACSSITIDMHSCLNWREQLFGRVVLIGNELTLKKGPLFDGIHESTTLELFNLVANQEKEILDALALAEARGYFLYYGHRILVGAQLKVTIKTKTLALPPIEDEPAPLDAVPINTYWFDRLIIDKQVGSDGLYTEKPGLIASMTKGAVAHLYLEGELSSSQSHRLVSEAQQFDVELKLYRKQPLIEAYKLEELSEPLCFDVDDMSFSDLFYQLEFDQTERGFCNFKVNKGAVFNALMAGQDIILQGGFSDELWAYLQPLRVAGCRGISVMGEWVPFSAKLLLVEEDRKASLKRAPYIEPEYGSSLDLSQAIDFIAARKKQLFIFFDESPIVCLSGESGVGKSSLMKELSFDGIPVYRELKQLEAWALDSREQVKILFIDEYNIENLHFMFLAPMLRNKVKPSILYENKMYQLDPYHKVVFAGNPHSYGGGRVIQKLFEHFAESIPSFHLNDFPASYIYHQIMKPILDEVSRKNTLIAFDPEEIMHMIDCYHTTNKTKPGAMTVRALQQNLLAYCHTLLLAARSPRVLSLGLGAGAISFFSAGSQRRDKKRGRTSDESAEEQSYAPKTKKLQIVKDALSDSAFEGELPRLQTAPKDRAFVEIPSNKPICDSLIKQLQIKQCQKAGELPGSTIGLNAVILEGKPGVGKSELILHVLNKTKYPYERIPAGLSLPEKERRLVAAFHRGSAVLIDELNCCCDDGLEKILNSLLTGVDLEGRYAENQGFILFGTMNGGDLKGRSTLSPALWHRFVHLDVPMPTVEDVEFILNTIDEDTVVDGPFRRLIAEEFVALQQTEKLNLRSLFDYMKSQLTVAPSAIDALAYYKSGHEDEESCGAGVALASCGDF
jgi:hypothetical protein